MASSRGHTSYLHAKALTLPNGTALPVHYFNRRIKRGETVPTLPGGYEVAEKAANGLPYLRRVARAAVGTSGSGSPAPAPGVVATP